MDFGWKKGEIHFQTNFAHLDILKNFDSISMSKKAWHFLKSPQNVSSSPALAALRAARAGSSSTFWGLW